MKTLRVTTIVMTASVMLATVLAIAAVRTAASAPPDNGLIGAWTGGTVDEYLEWMGTHTGSTARSGEMQLSWVYVKDGLLTVGGAYPTVTYLTPGYGVWEQVGKGKFKYTWYARGVDNSLDDTPIVYYTVRVTGLTTFLDNDNVNISYTYEIFSGLRSPEDMATMAPVEVYVGQANETRLPLVTP